uniref:GCV_T domain-containing protein n=1 Tax=Rhabditophanes sp. KR3021 TaxID=114890 RepID=A0AC35TSY7_9BILA
MIRCLPLVNRQLISLHGKDTFDFLQKLLTKDLRPLNECERGTAYSYLLNARGRIVTDLMLYKRGDEILIETEVSIAEKLKKILKTYKLRRDVNISDVEDAIFFTNTTDSSSNKFYLDPRIPNFGGRFLLNKEDAFEHLELNYDLLRMKSGLAEGSIETSEQLPLNMNGDLMNGINFDKGCYIGQELTARTNFLGVVRKRLLPLEFLDDKAQLNDELINSKGKKCGKIIKRVDNLGIGIVSVQEISNIILNGDAEVRVKKPEWWPTV